METFERRYACAAKALKGNDFLLPGASDHYPPDLQLEPIHLDFEGRVDIAARSLEVRLRHHLRANAKGADSVCFDAIGVEGLKVESEEHPIRWRYDGERVEVSFEEGLARGELVSLVLTYQVRSPVAGLYFSSPSPENPNAPSLAFTDNETERARHWLVTVDGPSVRPSLEISLRAKSHLVSLANGALVSSVTHDDGTTTTRWRLEEPCPSYLTSFVVGELVRFDDVGFKDIPISYFGPKGTKPEDLKRSFGRTAKMLEWMSEKLATAYPYPKYYQFAVPEIGGAMENISLVSWDQIFVLDEELAREWGWLVDQINLHEMAHSYFGDMVVCRDYAHAWLKESFAVYMETCWLEHSLGREEADYDFYSCVKRYLNEADGRYMRPIVTRHFNSSWQLYDRHLYPGGAARLHTLKHLLGEEAFWEGVRVYLKRYRFKSVETDDFRRVMEEVSGRSLGRFFDQWFHQKGYPSLKVEFSYDPDGSLGSFTLEQVQRKVEKEAPIFDLKILLAWRCKGKEGSRSVVMDQERLVVSIPMDCDPEVVRVDPKGQTLMKLDFDPGVPRLERELESEEIFGRIHAAQVLAKKSTPTAIARVLKALSLEPFWGVKIEMIEALASSGAPSAMQGLVSYLSREEDPMVLPTLLGELGRFRSRAVRGAIEERLVRGDLGYRAEGEALIGLGKQREAAPWSLILEASSRERFGGHTQWGAMRALAETRHEGALEALLGHVQDPALEPRVRAAAVGALGELAKVLERRSRERAVEALVDRLREPSQALRRAVVHALASYGGRASVEALEALKGRVSLQERVDVERALTGARKAHLSQGKASEERVQELEERLSALQQRLEKLEALSKIEAG